ncbi:MAG: prolyl oligopeptidase family serine peptidase [Ferruginibacter sp.]|nr:prolyl oligopeptidase family serine peptidase [Ferruginibacter sp.]
MNDVRVLPVESEEIVAGVKKNNIPVEYISFPDEGHGFVKKENQVTTSKKTLEFLDKYLYLHKEPFYLTLNDFQPHERSLYYLRGKNADW